MERLLADATKLSGVEYNIDNLADVYSAIHVIQEDLKLTGVAADEAGTTFSGSFQAMKAAAQNFLGALTTGGDIEKTMNEMLTSTKTFLVGNFLPMIGNVLWSIPTLITGLADTLAANMGFSGEGVKNFVNGVMSWFSAMASAIMKALPTILNAFNQLRVEVLNWLTSIDWGAVIQNIVSLFNQMISSTGGLLEAGINLVRSIASGIVQNLPLILETGKNLIDRLISSILENLPAVAASAFNIIQTLGAALIENLPQMVKNGVEVVGSLVNGMIDALPAIVDGAAQMLGQLINYIAAHLPEIVQTGVEIIAYLATGLLKAIPHIVAAIPQIIKSIINLITSVNWIDVGKNIILGIARGLANAGPALIQAALDAVGATFNAILDFLGIHSPSTLMRDMVGENMAYGIGEGFTSGLDDVDFNAPLQDATSALSTDVAFDAGVTSGGTQPVSYGGFTINVYASTSDDAKDIADEVERRIADKIRRQREV